MMWKTYHIWKRWHSDPNWTITHQSVKARTDKEAQTRMQNRFRSYGLCHVSLIAIEEGKKP